MCGVVVLYYCLVSLYVSHSSERDAPHIRVYILLLYRGVVECKAMCINLFHCLCLGGIVMHACNLVHMKAGV